MSTCELRQNSIRQVTAKRAAPCVKCCNTPVIRAKGTAQSIPYNVTSAVTRNPSRMPARMSKPSMAAISSGSILAGADLLGRHRIVDLVVVREAVFAAQLVHSAVGFQGFQLDRKRVV